VLTNPALKDKAEAILEAKRKAGQELVEVDGVSAETMAEIKQDSREYLHPFASAPPQLRDVQL
jgi:hypothetical protein